MDDRAQELINKQAPVLHLGRPWLAYWLFPYPNTMKVWPQFRSPLVWDVFAVSTYATISLLFWFIGLIPDLATLRDRSENRAAQIVYGMLAMGWRGSARHWARYEMAYLLLAGLSTPLVLSVHIVVCFYFAIGMVQRCDMSVCIVCHHTSLAVTLVQEATHQPGLVVPDFRTHPDGHVDEAFHHRGRHLASLLPDFLLAHVFPDALGLDDVHRHDRLLSRLHVP